MTRVAVDEETETDIMVAFVLRGDPEQVGITRCLVRAALEYRGLGVYADDAEAVASELVTNAIQHAATDVCDKVGVTLMGVWGGDAVAVVVTDPSPVPPVIRPATPASDHGRGLRIVEALSAHWSWNPEDDGKAVYAILTRDTP
jgi:anti-sigma regulatory factor (Ser/Thr protein kinase)